MNIAKLKSLEWMEIMTFEGHFQAYTAKHISNIYSVTPGNERNT